MGMALEAGEGRELDARGGGNGHFPYQSHWGQAPTLVRGERVGSWKHGVGDQ